MTTSPIASSGCSELSKRCGFVSLKMLLRTLTTLAEIRGRLCVRANEYMVGFDPMSGGTSNTLGHLVARVGRRSTRRWFPNSSRTRKIEQVRSLVSTLHRSFVLDCPAAPRHAAPRRPIFRTDSRACRLASAASRLAGLPVGTATMETDEKTVPEYLRRKCRRVIVLIESSGRNWIFLQSPVPRGKPFWTSQFAPLRK